MNKIILASASPRRSELLARVGINFEIQPSLIDESSIEITGSPEQKAMQLALLKARDVAKSLEKGIVLGADTIVVLDGEIFGKPKDNEEAFLMLSNLSGRSHTVITGVAIVNAENGLNKVSFEATKVTFSHLTPSRIQAYISTGEPWGKAGAYAVQGKGSLFIERIEGCYFNVVGLPLARVGKMLEEFGISLL
jgi:septum formation protein